MFRHTTEKGDWGQNRSSLVYSGLWSYDGQLGSNASGLVPTNAPVVIWWGDSRIVGNSETPPTISR
jgi:hypothetical protein